MMLEGLAIAFDRVETLLLELIEVSVGFYDKRVIWRFFSQS